MKGLLFFLIAGTLMAQNFIKPDLLVSMLNSSAKCKVISIDEQKVEISTAPGSSSRFLLQSVREININSLGIVYDKEKGFVLSLSAIQNFLNDRNEKDKDAQNLDSFLNTGKEMANEEEDFFTKVKCGEKRWSFGILYNPEYTIGFYPLYSQYIRNYYVNYSVSIPQFETQVSFKLFERLHLAGFFGYSSQYSESLNKSNSSSGDYNYYSGSETIASLKLLKVELGIKYYLGDLIENEVSAYTFINFGKQFAFSDDSYKDLYPQGSSQISTDNANEFNEQINSPWLASLGFGTEYFFNKSLSLIGIYKFTYLSYSGNYWRKNTAPDYLENQKTKQKFSQIFYYGALGLNFYF